MIEVVDSRVVDIDELRVDDLDNGFQGKVCEDAEEEDDEAALVLLETIPVPPFYLVENDGVGDQSA